MFSACPHIFRMSFCNLPPTAIDQEAKISKDTGCTVLVYMHQSCPSHLLFIIVKDLESRGDQGCACFKRARIL